MLYWCLLFPSKTFSPGWHRGVFHISIQLHSLLSYLRVVSVCDECLSFQCHLSHGNVFLIVRENIASWHSCHARNKAKHTSKNHTEKSVIHNSNMEHVNHSPATRGTRGVERFSMYFYPPTKTSRRASNDVICMHCPIQIWNTVGLPSQELCSALHYRLLLHHCVPLYSRYKAPSFQVICWTIPGPLKYKSRWCPVGELVHINSLQFASESGS